MTTESERKVVAVTGANGFIGKQICTALEARGNRVRRIVRDGAFHVAAMKVGDIGPNTAWSAALEGVDCVIHTAARAHVIKERSAEPLRVFRRVNAEGTRRLAEEAARAGVRRIVYISTVGVLGCQTSRHAPFDNHSSPAPKNHYAISKLEAEMALMEVSRGTGLEFVIVRPPLVYGPHAPGNFSRLLGLIRNRIPVPVGLVNNVRSLVGIDNLIDLLIHCRDRPEAAGEVFLVSDGDDVSTRDLLRTIGILLGRRCILLPVPPALLRLGGRLTGRLAEVEKLIGSLCVDISHTCGKLGWSPPFALEEGLRRAVGESSRR